MDADLYTEYEVERRREEALCEQRRRARDAFTLSEEILREYRRQAMALARILTRWLEVWRR